MFRRICQLLLLLVCVMGYCSCSFSGLTSGYNKLTPEEKSKVVDVKASANEAQTDGKVYKLNDKQLSLALSGDENAIVYRYLYYCSSKGCKPLPTIEEICKKHGCKLYIVSVVYDKIFETSGITSPIFIIDDAYYHTTVRDKYERLFFDGLTGTTEKERGYGIYHYFHKGKYVGTYEDCTDIPYIH